MSGTTGTKGFHYAWLVAASCFLMLFCAIGLNSTGISVFLPALIDKLDLSRTLASSIMSVQSLVTIFSLWLAGVIYKKRSVRMFKYLFVIVGVLGFVVFAFASSLAMCYIASILTGFALGCGAMIPVTILVNRWFIERRGAAMGLVTIGSGVANLVFSPIITMIIQNYSVTAAFLSIGAVILVLETVAFLLVRDYPRDKGLEPLGYHPPEEGADTSGEPSYLQGYTLREAMKTSNFYILVAVALMMGFTVQPAMSHIVVYATSSGYDPMVAASMFSIVGGLGLITKPAYGMLKDKLGTYRSNTVIFLCWIIGLASAVLLPMGTAFAYLFIIIFVCGVPMGTMSKPFWIVDMFGNKEYGAIFSYIMVFSQIGITIGLTMFGVFADLTGTYLYGFLTSAALMVVCFILIQGMYRRKMRETAEAPQPAAAAE